MDLRSEAKTSLSFRSEDYQICRSELEPVNGLLVLALSKIL